MLISLLEVAAREYAERWHHLQQIRLAVGREGILTRELYHPALDCFLRALPHLYRDVEGARLRVDVSGDCGGSWHLPAEGGAWAARVTIPHEIALRIFTKGIDRREAAGLVTIEGDRELGRRVLTLTAIAG